MPQSVERAQMVTGREFSKSRDPWLNPLYPPRVRAAVVQCLCVSGAQRVLSRAR